MSKKIELFIGGRKVDLDDDVSILLTKQLNDIFDPSKIKNDFSKTVSLPQTKNNNNIFGNIYNINKIITTDPELIPILKIDYLSDKIIGNDDNQYIQFTAFDIIDDLILQCDADFLISTDKVNWVNNLSISPSNNNISLTKIYVKLNNTEGKYYDGLLKLYNDKILEEVYIYGEIYVPRLSIEYDMNSFYDFKKDIPQKYTINGYYLTENILVESVDGFEISFESGGTYSTSLNIPYGQGQVKKDIWVKYPNDIIYSFRSKIYNSTNEYSIQKNIDIGVIQNSFITEWNMDVDEFTLPTGTNNTYNWDYYIDWGDGSPEEHITSSSNPTHTYSTAGIYNISIRGSFPHLYINNLTERSKLLRVLNFGRVGFRSMSRMFYGCDNLTYVPEVLTGAESVTDMSYMFYRCTSLNCDISSWDVSNVKNMGSLFFGCSLFNSPLNDWNVSSVTNMSSMFYGCSVFDQPLNDWDVSSVTNMSGMFRQDFVFNQPLNKWDVSSVTSMDKMFYGCYLFDQPLNDWDVSNVTGISSMFRNCLDFNQPLNKWSVSNVTNMSYIFSNASSFNQPLNDWNVSNVTNMIYMFSNASSFNQDLSGWCVSQLGAEPFNFSTNCPILIEYKPVWGTCPNLFITEWNMDVNEFTLPTGNNEDWNWDYYIDWGDGSPEESIRYSSNPTHTYSTAGIYNISIRGSFPHLYMFDGGNNKSKLLRVLNWGRVGFRTMSRMFYGCDNLTYVSPLLTGAESVTDMGGMFNGCHSFNSPLNDWDVSNVTNISDIFKDCHSFNQDLNNWDVSNILSFGNVFNNCYDFNGDISDWDTSNCTYLGDTFSGCHSFNQPLNNWDTSKVTSMMQTFYNCYDFNQNINSWDTSKVNSMMQTFFNCQSFDQPLYNWDVSNVIMMQFMFYGCSVFNQDLSGWCVSLIDSEPFNFSTNSALIYSNKPIWGTCP